MLDLSGGGLTFSLVPFNPQVFIDPTDLVKNSQKYIADPLWFYHKSSTADGSEIDVSEANDK